MNTTRNPGRVTGPWYLLLGPVVGGFGGPKSREEAWNGATEDGLIDSPVQRSAK
ncbi:MAG: hypothetical protein QOF89_3214 [Acidobacteriota bacterium]|jgi:hypothetical protein|nr:hypothetical protein [Acidobacteriota bacterium]